MLIIASLSSSNSNSTYIYVDLLTVSKDVQYPANGRWTGLQAALDGFKVSIADTHLLNKSSMYKQILFRLKHAVTPGDPPEYILLDLAIKRC